MPGNILPNAAIPFAILVIERSVRPTDTLFAIVGEDWASQLRRGGELHDAYLVHRDQT
jgi:hypothetical protein